MPSSPILHSFLPFNTIHSKPIFFHFSLLLFPSLYQSKIFNSTMVEKAGDSVPTSNTSPSHPPKFESNLPSHQQEKLVMVYSILGLSPSNEHPSPMLQNLPLILHGSDNLPGTEEGCRFGDGRQLAVSEDPSSVNFSQQLLSSVHEGHEEDENEDPSPKKSKRGKHSGNKGIGSQKAVEQTTNGNGKDGK